VPDDPMIEQAWNEYRGWAERSRSLQGKTGRWNFWALVMVIVAALAGAAASYFSADASDGSTNETIGRALACAAMVASVLAVYFAREILAVSAESGWIRARATAEAIKSECFRFAAGVGDYAPDKVSEAEAANAFIERRKAIAAAALAASLTSEDDQVGAKGDDRRPSRPMTADWYLKQRIDEQIAYYGRGKAENESACGRLQMIGFAAGAISVAFGAAATFYRPRFAEAIGALTTIAAAVTAYGLIDRRKFLAASYAAMKANLERLKERFEVGGVTLQALVAAAEDLMECEHAVWIDQMAKTIRPAPSPPPEASQAAAQDGAEPKTS
jgi:conflict system pore-forming effector with SLATT domain/uncharacterized protein DUF4231